MTASAPPTSGNLKQAGEGVWEISSAASVVEFDLPLGPVFLLDGSEELYVLPSDAEHGSLTGFGTFWALQESAREGVAWLIEANAQIVAERTEIGWHVTVDELLPVLRTPS